MIRSLLLSFLLLTGCASVQPRVIGQGERYGGAASAGGSYALGVGDRIHLTVFKEDGLSGEFPVNPAGKVALPLIGDVPALGATTVDLGKAIRARLADGYLVDPRVSVEIASYRPYFVLGEVRTPGQYPYASGLTVTSAVAQAGGFTPRAEKRIVYIRQPGADDEKAYRLRPDLMIRPGDTIRLGERLF
ncbi:polysaccharide biosynthesis protein [Nostoc sp. 3335mG]|nr:polysaccharide biosynthesis protein [Nostoc sp. 3335mG]